jgi:hypothetical protein
MSRTLKVILAINLLLLVALTFAWPHLMVGPGKLIPGHQALGTDCFACHSAFTGASAAKCISCHKPADIGKLTTLGAPIAKPLSRTPFHQALSSQNCMGCHSDHAGVRRYHLQGSFDHSLLNTATASQCQSCHTAPTDPLHRQISGNCSQCHSSTQWTPATFDHAKYFVLDRDHDAPCATCHVRNDYRSYTCYGCHEHTVANIRREHVEEGIRDFTNCVSCHRSSNKHDIQGKEGFGGGERKASDKNKGDDD